MDGPQAEASKAAAHSPEGDVERLRIRREIERDPVATHGGSQPRDGIEGIEDGGVELLVNCENFGGGFDEAGEVHSWPEAEAVVE